MGEEALLDVDVAVVGHVEWAEFALVERLPAPGEILDGPEHWAEAAGGGAVAAVQLAKLVARPALFTALAGDPRGRAAGAQLTAAGLAVHAGKRGGEQRHCWVYLEAGGERTITVLGPRLVPHGDDPLPWEALDATDGVYFTGGDAGALRAARRARVLVATPRAGRLLDDTGVRLDVLVRSGSDPGEQLDPASLASPPRHVVTTLGARGGRWEGEAGAGTWAAAPLPGPAVDAYGAGDSFAAALTAGLAAGMDMAGATALAARAGAANLTGRGPYAGQLDLRG
jgi:ribokinase